MLQNKQFWRKTGIPLVTMLSEVLLLAVYLFFLTPDGSSFLISVLENGSADDSVTGWLIGPALIGDALVFVALTVMFLVIVFFVGLALFAGIWNIAFNYLNKNRTKGLLICALVPSALWMIGFLLFLLAACDIFSSGILLMWIPLVIHIAGLVLQIYLFREEISN